MMNGSVQPRKSFQIPAIVALVAAAVVFLFALYYLTNYAVISFGGIFYTTGLIVISALLVRHTASPHEMTYRAAVIAVITVFALTPVITTAGTLTTLLRSAVSGDSSPTNIVLLQGMNDLFTLEAWYPAMMALGILIMMEKDGAARIVAIVAMVLLVHGHFLAPLIDFIQGGVSADFTAKVRDLLAFPAEILILITLYGMLVCKTSPLQGALHE